MTPKCTDEEFIAVWKQKQSAMKVAQHFGMSERRTHKKRRTVEKKHGIVLPVFDINRPKYNTASIDQKAIATLQIDTGAVLIGSDIHLAGRENNGPERLPDLCQAPETVCSDPEWGCLGRRE